MKYETQVKMAESIRHLRGVYGYTQSQVASRLHISRSTYVLLESGKKIPSIDTILDLAELYGVSFHSLVRGDVENTDMHSTSYTNENGTYDTLTSIYSQLSAYSRGALLERAIILLEQEQKLGSPN